MLTLQQYRVGQEVRPFLVFEFPLLLDALYLQFLFTPVSFSLNYIIHSTLSADLNRFCFNASRLLD